LHISKFILFKMICSSSFKKIFTEVWNLLKNGVNVVYADLMPQKEEIRRRIQNFYANKFCRPTQYNKWTPIMGKIYEKYFVGQEKPQRRHSYQNPKTGELGKK